MQRSRMTLKILLPTGIFLEESNISNIVAESSIGFFGLLAHRLDCATSLVPSILIYHNESENFIALDRGVLMKTGLNITVSVRNAIKGKGLDQLQQAIDEKFRKIDEQESKVRQVMAKMEGTFLKHLSDFKNE